MSLFAQRSAFNLHKARVRRASGFLLTGFSNARPTRLLPLPKGV